MHPRGIVRITSAVIPAVSLRHGKPCHLPLGKGGVHTSATERQIPNLSLQQFSINKNFPLENFFIDYALCIMHYALNSSSSPIYMTFLQCLQHILHPCRKHTVICTRAYHIDTEVVPFCDCFGISRTGGKPD